jgi:hypothetical protein
LNRAAAAILLLLIFTPGQARAIEWPFHRKNPNQQAIFVPYEALSDGQLRLLETLKESRQYTGDLESFWYVLGKDNTAQRTFFAVTDAMEHRKTKNGETALDQIEAIEDVEGQEKDKASAEQFNIKVRWKAPPPGMKSIREQFETPDYSGRLSADHPGEVGVQEKNSGYRGLHLLFQKDNEREGHVHIDFRKTSWFEAVMTKLHLKFLIPKFLKKGHFDPGNADLGAVGPEKEKGKPISNLEWFEKTYDEPRVGEYTNPEPYLSEYVEKMGTNEEERTSPPATNDDSADPTL